MFVNEVFAINICQETRILMRVRFALGANIAPVGLSNPAAGGGFAGTLWVPPRASRKLAPNAKRTLRATSLDNRTFVLYDTDVLGISTVHRSLSAQAVV
ncbi:MAG: hypothetical protein KDE58_09295, partial [Caldilineaceae bacterium]|nr:hypothetical protein [Caldilineaceae bacterium]